MRAVLTGHSPAPGMHRVTVAELLDDLEMLYEGEQRAHEETKRRLDAALDRLDLIDRRLAWLAGDGDWS